ncbi:hypothetical protein E8E13_008322 [Curvularia kusanoi]|uniref:Glycoside hydrolase family 12 protein n=1 Tax=Curvularia kusanoi TaxID=90978 RepID=A0A9P4TLD6_CURKU|nr:hypothetical protein E8E13_008322 [Curvularia kusanoi]
MPGLNTLPNELLHDILTYILDPEFGTTSATYLAFAGLARSCRALNAISTQYLYARYESPLEQPRGCFLRHLSRCEELYDHLKHINILANAHYTPLRPSTRKQLIAQISGLSEPYRSTWTKEAQNNVATRNELELAILVLRATNLESMTMERGAERIERRFDDLSEPPPWLLPLTNTGLAYSSQILGSNVKAFPYQTLHSLTLNLQYSNPYSLMHLFALPALRSLHLINLLDHAFLHWLRNGGGWEDLNTYPDPSPRINTPHSQSTVTSLVLENINIPTAHTVSMLQRCTALQTFSVTGVESPLYIFSESRRWCVNILQALAAHKHSLQHLRLDPDLVWQLDADGGDEWASLHGFGEFKGLKSLDTTFSNLFGHPRGRLLDGGVFRFEDGVDAQAWWTPAKDFLPDSCEELRVRFDGVLEVNCDELFLGLLNSASSRLRMNFWDVQRAFREDGRIDFDYTKGFDYWDSEMDFSKFDDVAYRLAQLGAKGVAMATHYEGYGEANGLLQDRVMELLGLDRSWLFSVDGFLSVALAAPTAEGTSPTTPPPLLQNLTPTAPPSALLQRSTPTTRTPTTVLETVSLCTQYAYYSTAGYEILNNLWGKDAASSGSQCTYYEGSSSSGSGIKWSSTWTWQGAENNVKSYVYAGRIVSKGNTIANIKTMSTQIDWNYNTTNNVRANVAYDIFTAQDPNHVNSSGDYELMIWLGRLGGVWPISQSGSPIATVTIAGYNFDLYFGYNGSMKVYSFVRSGSNDITSFRADVKLFFNYLVSNQQYPASSQNLIVYQIGTEAFTGGPAKFSVSSFSAGITV